MPDLGKYGDVVLFAYAVTIVLIVGLVAVSLWQSVRTRTRLKDIEDRTRE